MTSVSSLDTEWNAQSRGDDPCADFALGFAVEPIVDLATLEENSPYSECLARLLIDETLHLRAGAFVGDLEAGGVVGILDAVIVDLVLDALAADPAVRLGCNISPKTLSDPWAWDAILAKIAERSRLAVRLTLEVTESAPLDVIDDAAVRLNQAKAYGCRIALDDFGTGYAVADRLRGLEVNWDIIKIDRSYLGNLRQSPSCRDGLASIVALAGCLAPVIVVEGVETPAHLALARACGAHFGQGFLFDGKMPTTWQPLDPHAHARFAGALRHNKTVVPLLRSTSSQTEGPFRRAVEPSSGSRLFHPGQFMRSVMTRVPGQHLLSQMRCRQMRR